jgi:hypothetical protein
MSGCVKLAMSGGTDLEFRAESANRGDQSAVVIVFDFRLDKLGAREDPSCLSLLRQFRHNREAEADSVSLAVSHEIQLRLFSGGPPQIRILPPSTFSARPNDERNAALPGGSFAADLRASAFSAAGGRTTERGPALANAANRGSFLGELSRALFPPRFLAFCAARERAKPAGCRARAHSGSAEPSVIAGCAAMAVKSLSFANLAFTPAGLRPLVEFSAPTVPDGADPAISDRYSFVAPPIAETLAPIGRYTVQGPRPSGAEFLEKNESITRIIPKTRVTAHLFESVPIASRPLRVFTPSLKRTGRRKAAPHRKKVRYAGKRTHEAKTPLPQKPSPKTSLTPPSQAAKDGRGTTPRPKRRHCENRSPQEG